MSVAEEVGKALTAAFTHEPRINPQRRPVRIDWSDGSLTLEGEVGHVAAKKLILEVAAAVPGVGGIVDRLHVAPAQPGVDNVHNKLTVQK